MGNAQSYGVASVALCSVYLVYVHIYCSHKLLKTNVLTSDRLPSVGYLYVKYVCRALTRRRGLLHTAATTTKEKKKSETVYTVLRCRLETPVLRRFCSAAGYGWDYPDTEYRDVPLCFPEVLCGRLMLMVLTDQDFRLSPAGLVRVRQSLRTLQPIDELKKGPFTLQVRVLEYRQTDAGVEADVCLSATSRSGSPVWESVLTLLSKNKLHKASTKSDSQSRPDEPVPGNMRQVELKVPWSTGPFGCRITPGLWMLSVCLAEIEKHKGVEVITAPVNVSAEFKEPLSVPGKATIRFWETTGNRGQSSAQGLSFHMQQHGSNVSHVVGQISRC